ncbi:MAG: YdcF family protein, partial [Reyranella sp.]|nr:YdcF family protein [Reyranella sp.]
TLVVLGLIWAVGLLAFAQRIERLTPATEPPVADAVVALTGASDLRLEAAVRLLERGKGRRLLISGVNREASRADILTVTRAAKPIYDCCVDLGFSAVDTLGNAREIAEWARGKNYDSLIVVTSDYHMPRAMLLIRAAMPEATLTAYPVVTGALDVRHWWRRNGDAKRLTLEYSKYLAVLARESVRSLTPASNEPPPAEADAGGTKP